MIIFSCVSKTFDLWRKHVRMKVMYDITLVCAVRRIWCVSERSPLRGRSRRIVIWRTHGVTFNLRRCEVSLFHNDLSCLCHGKTTRADCQTAGAEKNSGEVWDNWLIISLSVRFLAVQWQLRYVGLFVKWIRKWWRTWLWAASSADRSRTGGHSGNQKSRLNLFHKSRDSC